MISYITYSHVLNAGQCMLAFTDSHWLILPNLVTLCPPNTIQTKHLCACASALHGVCAILVLSWNSFRKWWMNYLYGNMSILYSFLNNNASFIQQIVRDRNAPSHSRVRLTPCTMPFHPLAPLVGACFVLSLIFMYPLQLHLHGSRYACQLWHFWVLVIQRRASLDRIWTSWNSICVSL